MEISYEKLSDQISLLEGNLHVIQIISKDDKVTLMDKMKSLELHMNDKNKKLIDLLKSLESFIVQEVQTLQKSGDKSISSLRRTC